MIQFAIINHFELVSEVLFEVTCRLQIPVLFFGFFEVEIISGNELWLAFRSITLNPDETIGFESLLDNMLTNQEVEVGLLALGVKIEFSGSLSHTLCDIFYALPLSSS